MLEDGDEYGGHGEVRLGIDGLGITGVVRRDNAGRRKELDSSWCMAQDMKIDGLQVFEKRQYSKEEAHCGTGRGSRYGRDSLSLTERCVQYRQKRLRHIDGLDTRRSAAD